MAVSNFNPARTLRFNNLYLILLYPITIVYVKILLNVLRVKYDESWEENLPIQSDSNYVSKLLYNIISLKYTLTEITSRVKLDGKAVFE